MKIPKLTVTKYGNQHEGTGFTIKSGEEYMVKFKGKSRFVKCIAIPSNDPTGVVFREKSGKETFVTCC